MATDADLLERPNLPAPGPNPLSQIAAGFAEAFRGVRRAAADRSLMSGFLALSLAAAGFFAFYLGWRGAAATLVVGVQLAYLVSGGLAGFALMGFGLAIFHIQASRRIAAREDRAWALVLDRALALLETVKKRNVA